MRIPATRCYFSHYHTKYFLAMVIAQAFMGAPFVLIIVWIGTFLAAFLSLSIINFLIQLFQRTKRTQEERNIVLRIHLIAAAVLACLGCVFFIYKLITFEGPWIN